VDQDVIVVGLNEWVRQWLGQFLVVDCRAVCAFLILVGGRCVGLTPIGLKTNVLFRNSLYVEQIVKQIVWTLRARKVNQEYGIIMLLPWWHQSTGYTY